MVDRNRFFCSLRMFIETRSYKTLQRSTFLLFIIHYLKDGFNNVTDFFSFANIKRIQSTKLTQLSCYLSLSILCTTIVRISTSIIFHSSPIWSLWMLETSLKFSFKFFTFQNQSTRAAHHTTLTSIIHTHTSSWTLHLATLYLHFIIFLLSLFKYSFFFFASILSYYNYFNIIFSCISDSTSTYQIWKICLV